MTYSVAGESGRLAGAERGRNALALAIFLLAAAASPRDLAVPVRLTDGPAALALVSAGERVAIIAAGDNGVGGRGHVRTVVAAVRVLAVPEASGDSGGGLIIVAATARQAVELARIPAGDRVLHSVFGMGSVVATSGAGDNAKADVDFGSAGIKRLALKHAPLEKL